MAETSSWFPPPVADAKALLPPSWVDQPLPAAWPDDGPRLARLARWFFRALRGHYEPAELPPELPSSLRVPDYARQAFHGLPNGYYSHDVVAGYDRGFEWAMLGRVQGARERMAAALRGRRRVLDVGCGTGRLAQAVRAAGADEVWGIDPSPYMLKRAVQRAPEVRFTQGIVEHTAFPEAYFDGAAACFLFHELPADVARQGLRELGRILRPGALLCITDPCPDHLSPKSRWELWRTHGWSALYFHVLARFVYEPFLADWRSLGDYRAWFAEGGFEMVARTVELPFEALVARRL